MYCILVAGKCIYACTDETRFARESVRYANVSNCSFEFRRPRILTEA